MKNEELKMKSSGEETEEVLFAKLGKLVYKVMLERVPNVFPSGDLLSEADKAFAYCKAAVVSYARAGEVLGCSAKTASRMAKRGDLVIAEDGKVTALSVYRHAVRKAEASINEVKKKW